MKLKIGQKVGIGYWQDVGEDNNKRFIKEYEGTVAKILANRRAVIHDRKGRPIRYHGDTNVSYDNIDTGG